MSKTTVSLDDIEDQLEREKRLRLDADKAKRKIEGELKMAQEQMDELARLKSEAESSIKKREV